MTPDTEMNIDFERLRKKLVAQSFASGFTTVSVGNIENCSAAYDATPEQLIAMAKRNGINLDKYKIK